MTPLLLFLEFGGEERPFRCLLGELRKIQAACDAGPPEIARRLAACVRVQRTLSKLSILDQAAVGLGDWRIDDVREPILQGLMGAGATPTDAAKLVRTWIDERGFRGLVENAELALTILVAGVATPEDYTSGETAGEAETPAAKPKPTSPTASGTSKASTKAAARSAAPRGRSTK